MEMILEMVLSQSGEFLWFIQVYKYVVFFLWTEEYTMSYEDIIQSSHVLGRVSMIGNVHVLNPIWNNPF